MLQTSINLLKSAGTSTACYWQAQLRLDTLQGVRVTVACNKLQVYYRSGLFGKALGYSSDS
jgi:hypothetical protein